MSLPRSGLFLSVLLTVLHPAASAAPADKVLVFFGTRETGPERGFSVAQFDPATGALGQPEFLVAAIGPAFFQIHPDGRHLYTVNTRGNTPAEGLVSAYALDPATGRLTLLNSQPSGGVNPAYLALDKTGQYALVANFTSGTLAVFPILPDGSFGERTAHVQHQGAAAAGAPPPAPHAHSIITDPSNRFALACDLGLDRIYIYRFDEKTGTLTPHEPAFTATKTGAGPRHVIFHPNGKIVYVLCEVGNTVNTYAWDGAKGTLRELQSVPTLPADFKEASKTAEIALHPNGKFLYASNRGHNSIAVFAVDPATALLTPVEQVSTQGRTPRNFSLDPTGRWLMASNNDSNSVIVFGVDGATGKLTPAGPLTPLAAPFCERFLVVPPDPRP